MIVLDTSATLPLFLQDEDDKLVRPLFDHLGEVEFIVPALWYYELSNALLVALRAGRATDKQVASYFDVIKGLGVSEEDQSEQSLRLVKFANQFGLTVYDAAYLELADRKGAELATLDKQLAKAAKKLGVKLTLNA